MLFDFRPWKPFKVVRDRRVDHVFLTGLGKIAAEHFMDEMSRPKHGRWYVRRGKHHRASSPNEYPATDTGLMRGSEDFKVGSGSVTIGNSAPYAIYLRESTGKMERRKMSDTALTESTDKARHLLKGWAKWERT